MRALVTWCCALAATSAAAQPDGWAARVYEMARGFDAAVAAENIIPFGFENDHPRITAESATLLGMTPQEFDAAVRNGYQKASKTSEIVSYDRDAPIFGASENWHWAVMPYTISVEVDGQEGVQRQCNNLVVFGSDDQAYMVAIATERTAEVVLRVFPELIEATRAVKIGCSEN